MTAELLTMTVFFGERLRHDGRYAADALLQAHPIGEMAVVLRGAAGFGPRHELRSDLTLSMSEDPPVVVLAVDAAEHIAAAADRAAEVISRGAIALQRVRRADEAALPGSGHVELTVYTRRDDRLDGRPAHVAVCDLLRRCGLDAATTLLGVDGVRAGERCRARFFGRNGAVPVVTVAVGPAEAVGAALPLLRTTLPSAVLTVEYVERGVARHRPPGEAPHWRRVTIHTSEADLHRGVPVHRALLRRLRDSPTAAGLTVLRGVWGYTGDRKPVGDRVFQLGRRVPVTSHYVDTAAAITAVADDIEDIAGPNAVVTTSPVAAMLSSDGRHRRGDLRLTPPPGR